MCFHTLYCGQLGCKSAGELQERVQSLLQNHPTRGVKGLDSWQLLAEGCSWGLRTLPACSVQAAQSKTSVKVLQSEIRTWHSAATLGKAGD